MAKTPIRRKKVKKLRNLHNNTIEKREVRYLHNLEQQTKATDIDPDNTVLLSIIQNLWCSILSSVHTNNLPPLSTNKLKTLYLIFN